MIVCLCTGASDRDIRHAVESGAGSLREIGDSCQAGEFCGECQPALREMLDRESCAACPRRHSLGGVSPGTSGDN